MTEYFPRDMPTDIWKEILQRHWTYLETEDGMDKLEEKKKLIACLKEFLCIVPHDRKFFLPETAHVLKKSIKEMDNFSAYKAMIGFESISQYANNLFTKPWRKEFKVIKMYSGFYQHEIKSNLIDAEKLFKAMGYRQLPNQLLVLDGPICPDQVTNVSRDGMAAYVECQIMKNILNELDSLQVQCSWSEIFNFRESHVCAPSTAVKSISYAIQERRFRKEKQISHENCYATLPQQIINNCPTCYNAQSRNCRQTILPPLNGMNGGNCQVHGINSIPPQIIQSQKDYQKYGICGMHTKAQQQSSLLPNNIYNVPNQQIHNCNHHVYPSPPQMTHSKSLEHYAEPSTTNILPNIMPRHSFDQYDCIDGGGHQNCTNNYNQYNHHPYNVSGNRYPLPYQISNQISSNQSTYGHCQSILPTQSTTGGIINNYSNSGGGGGNQKILSDQQIYNDYNCLIKNSGNGIHSQNNIDTNCIVHSRGVSVGNNIQSAGIQTGRSPLLYTSNEIMDLYNKNIDNNYTTNDFIDDEIHSKRNSNQYEKINDNNSRQLLMKNNLIVHGGGLVSGNHEHILLNDSSNDSTSTTKSISTPQSQNKNQDGYGSFESWDFVFQNLEKNGYTKDLGERGDLLVQGLDLDSIKLNSSNNDKRKSREISTAIIQQTSNVTSGLQTPVTATGIQINKNKDNYDYSAGVGGNNRLSKNLDKNDQQVPQVFNKKIDKQMTTTGKANGHISTGKYKEKINNSTINRTQQQKSSKTIKNSINNNDNVIIDKTTKHDWNCPFCTYLNQESVRICEMCSRTKDFNLNGKN